MKEKIRRHIILYSYAAAFILGVMYELIYFFFGKYYHGDILAALLRGIIVDGPFCFHPFVLTVLNIIFMLKGRGDEELLKRGKRIEYLTLTEGLIFSLLLLCVIADIDFSADWNEVLYNNMIHTPVYTAAYPTVFVLLLAGIAGYIVLSKCSLERLSPLGAVLAMAAMYIGIAECVLYIVQLSGGERYLSRWTDVLIFPEWIYLLLLPFNFIVITLKTMRLKIEEWRMTEHSYDGRVLSFINRRLENSAYWPLAAFILAVPLFLMLIGILLLFGQSPDSAVKAWTQTAQWRLSLHEAPQNVSYDEHYLCTVAAGGHKKIVKPLRMGERHGHRVTVNRQLCIANAFEEIIAEKAPRFHRFIRRVYDTCGFPVARLIKSKLAADAVYFIMKPLEWLFLAVIYMCDTKPENRIAVQYLPRRG